MDLESFVSDSLQQVARGIAKANRELRDDGMDARNSFVLGYDKTHNGIDFDVAVTVSRSSGVKGGGTIAVAMGWFGKGEARAEGSRTSDKEHVSRIGFRVTLNDATSYQKLRPRPPESE